jgi:hypothetical protein
MEDAQMNTPSALSGLSQIPQSMQSSIIARTTTRFYTHGSSSFNRKYNKTMNFRLSSTDYVDLSTATLNFKLKTNASYQVPETCFPLAMIDSAVLKINQQDVEKIDEASACLRQLYWLSNDSNVITGPIGTAMGDYKFKTKNGTFLKNNSSGITDATNDIKPIQPLQDSTYKNFGTNSTFGPGASQFAVGGNSLDLLTCGGSLTLPEACFWSRQSASIVDDNRLVSGQDGSGRDYSVRVSDIFSFFKSSSYLPLRNVGSLEISITLTAYERCFINVPTFSRTNSTIASNLAGLSDADTLAICSNEDYNIISPYISIDTVQPNLLLVNAIDAKCQSAEGIAMVFDSWSTQLLSQPYGSAMQFTTNKGYSKIRDLCCWLRPQNLANGSKFLRYDQTYYGTRVLENKVIVGSSNFPLTSTDSTSARLMELQKVFADHNRSDGSNIIDYNIYTGQNSHIAASSRGYYPSLSLNSVSGVGVDNKACLAQAGCLWAEPNSQFAIGQSFEKFISKSRFLSGINTRLGQSQITVDLKMRPFKDTDPATDYLASTAPNTVDCILGNSGVAALLAVHYEALLLVANGAVSVQI